MKNKIKLPKEPMIYRDQIRLSEECELITKLRIIRDVEVHKYPETSVAEKFHTHRNTVGKIVRKFRNNISLEIQRKLLFSSLRHDELLRYLAPLKNESRRPHNNKRTASPEQEKLILKIFHEKKVRVGVKRLHKIIRRKCLDLGTTPREDQKELELLKTLSFSQIKGIYKRNKLKIKKVRTCNGQHTPIHDYTALACFEKLHYDTKIIPDQKALPPEIYQKFKLSKDLPIIEWNIIDAKSRTRFMAYSHNRTADFGLHFLLLVIQFLRAKNLISWDLRIIIGTDNGCEFFSGSERKNAEWNKLLNVLNAEIYPYEPGHDIRKNLIERSHKTDDEEFFVPRGFYINSKADFLLEAQDYTNYFNCRRSHSGIGMNDMTPLEKLQSSGLTTPEKILEFPTMILEDHINEIREATNMIRLFAELIECDEKNSNPKFFADIKAGFDKKFIESAHNVLTYYLV